MGTPNPSFLATPRPHCTARAGRVRGRSNVPLGSGSLWSRQQPAARTGPQFDICPWLPALRVGGSWQSVLGAWPPKAKSCSPLVINAAWWKPGAGVTPSSVPCSSPSSPSPIPAASCRRDLPAWCNSLELLISPAIVASEEIQARFQARFHKQLMQAHGKRGRSSAVLRTPQALLQEAARCVGKVVFSSRGSDAKATAPSVHGASQIQAAHSFQTTLPPPPAHQQLCRNTLGVREVGCMVTL